MTIEHPYDAESSSWASTPGVRRSMQSNRGRDTGPELRLRHVLHAMGLRYFVNRRPIKSVRRTADIVFPRARVAVFVDGCFWHSCPEHGTSPATHGSFWNAKLARTAERDLETDQMLQGAGWHVVRIWEHEDATSAAAAIAELIGARRTQGSDEDNTSAKTLKSASLR